MGKKAQTSTKKTHKLSHVSTIGGNEVYSKLGMAIRQFFGPDSDF